MNKENKAVWKELLSFFLLCLLIIAIVFALSRISMPKIMNRYFMLNEYLKENPEKQLCDVKVFGSCHAYTSFDPTILREQTGLSSFVYANPNEIIPITYARMAEQFKIHAPKVALVEAWGINPYDTYMGQNTIFTECLPLNLEIMKPSIPQHRVMLQYGGLKGIVTTYCPFLKYKARFTDGSLKDADFDYSFEATVPENNEYINFEMRSRLSNDGFKRNPSNPVPDYPEQQAQIETGALFDISPDIEEYIELIIGLCEEYDVKLIFYRAPYISSENELMRFNQFSLLCEERGIPYIDLEQEIAFDYSSDFTDYQHLSASGAKRATELLLTYIMTAVEEKA